MKRSASEIKKAYACGAGAGPRKMRAGRPPVKGRSVKCMRVVKSGTAGPWAGGLEKVVKNALGLIRKGIPHLCWGGRLQLGSRVCYWVGRCGTAPSVTQAQRPVSTSECRGTSRGAAQDVPRHSDVEMRCQCPRDGKPLPDCLRKSRARAPWAWLASRRRKELPRREVSPVITPASLRLVCPQPFCPLP